METNMMKVAITHGDTNGIGYELILKTFAEPAMTELCTPIVYGSPKVASYHRKYLNLPTNFSIIGQAEDAQDGKLNVLTTFEEEVKVELGQQSPESDSAALTALDRAVADFERQAYDALVTAPVNVIPESGFTSHTDYLEHRLGGGAHALRIIINEKTRVAVVADNLSLRDVPEAITKERVMETAKILHQSLRRDFNISNPRIATLMLNPQEGTEEVEQIKPAVEQLSDEGVQCFGPYPADRFFGEGMYSTFDAVLAMYYEQGVTPLKAIGKEESVCFSAGLPIVHVETTLTTAYDAAGKGETPEDSFRQAIYTAIDIARNRKRYDEPLGNPLKKLYHERREDGEKARFYPREPKTFGGGFGRPKNNAEQGGES